MNGDQWYFAYGSNLLVDQKEKRTGRIRQAVRSRLKGYRFAFNKRGGSGQIYANIVPDDTAEVWGVVYLCNPEAIRGMDQYEGVASGHYERIQVVVEKDTGGTVQAITYDAGEDFVCGSARDWRTRDYGGFGLGRRLADHPANGQWTRVQFPPPPLMANCDS